MLTLKKEKSKHGALTKITNLSNCMKNTPRSGPLLLHLWEIATKINVFIGTEDFLNLESTEKSGLPRKTKLSGKWSRKLEKIGNYSQKWLAQKLANKSENDSSTSLIQKSSEKTGQMKRTEKSFNCMQKSVVNGLKSVKNYQGDPKTKLKTDFTHTFKKTTTLSTKSSKSRLEEYPWDKSQMSNRLFQGRSWANANKM